MSHVPASASISAAIQTTPRTKAVGEELNHTTATDAVTPAVFTLVEDVYRFVFAGKAHFTIVSQKTGSRVSYRVKLGKKKPGAKVAPYFVSVIDDRTAADRYIGAIWTDTGAFTAPKKKELDPAMVRHREAFDWFLKMLCRRNEEESAAKANAEANGAEYVPGAISAVVQFWHAGYCARCGRQLTDPVQIHNGYGLHCMKVMGLSVRQPPKASDPAPAPVAVQTEASKGTIAADIAKKANARAAAPAMPTKKEKSMPTVTEEDRKEIEASRNVARGHGEDGFTLDFSTPARAAETRKAMAESPKGAYGLPVNEIAVATLDTAPAVPAFRAKASDPEAVAFERTAPALAKVAKAVQEGVTLADTIREEKRAMAEAIEANTLRAHRTPAVEEAPAVSEAPSDIDLLRAALALSRSEDALLADLGKKALDMIRTATDEGRTSWGRGNGKGMAPIPAVLDTPSKAPAVPTRPTLKKGVKTKKA